jgi:hypothetical protein
MLINLARSVMAKKILWGSLPCPTILPRPPHDAESRCRSRKDQG